MATVTLINPLIGVKKRYGKFGKAGSVVPPLGLCYIASTLESQGHKVRIIDGEISCSEQSDIVKHIGEDTDIIGITSSTPGISSAIEITRLIKEWDKDVPIVLGGPHVSSLPVETLETGLFNFGVLGEGELTMSNLVAKIGGGDPYGTDGIAYLSDGKVKINRKREPIKDLDTIPFPARHLLPDLRLYRPNAQNYKRLPTTTMVTSRGCPYGCIFCDKSVFGRSYRTHSPGYVVDEIEMLINEFKINEIWFVDDTFTLDNKRAEKICDMIVERGLDVNWSCLGQVSSVSPDLLKAMAKAGCWLISYGIESGNQAILDNAKKCITLKQVEQAVRWTRDAGIESKGFFILGLPKETIQTMDDTINFAKSLPLDQALFTIATPMPNTEMYSYAVENNLMFEGVDWSQHTMLNPIYAPLGLTGEILQKKNREGWYKFYLRPGYILSQILNLRSLDDLKRKLIGLKAILSI